ncbi:hypothetical protein AQUCO_03800029v1 [Aquilegia coerulea]|uniref:Uncharacterized protein n=1 Tax=Aquilegia coerulea TaxID=218851 RepID=A0A2G5CTF2_AQUCA|nr:hypothetical protein AQUCO_03800029v1 [Aquilegia coerulea]
MDKMIAPGDGTSFVPSLLVLTLLLRKGQLDLLLACHLLDLAGFFQLLVVLGPFFRVLSFLILLLLPLTLTNVVFCHYCKALEDLAAAWALFRNRRSGRLLHCLGFLKACRCFLD